MERRVFPEGKDAKGRALRRPALVALQELRARRDVHRRRRARLPLPAHARRRRLHLRAPHEGRALHHPHARAAGQGGGPARPGADGGPRHQGRPLRVHARQDRHRRAERPVPHPAPHHPAHGGDDRARSRTTSSATRPAAPCGFLVAAGEYLREHHPEILRDAKLQRALPPRHVPRLRLRHHHAAHRQHEHAAARRREPRHPLPRLARRRTTPATRSATPWSWPIRPSPARSTTRTPPRTCSRSSRPRRPSCSSWRCSCGCSSPAAAPPSSCPTACCSALSKAHKDAAPHAGRGAEARRRDLAARRRVQALRRRLHRHPALHQDQLRRHRPRLVLRRARPTAGASTTSARRCCPRTSSAPCRRPRSPPTSTPRTTCPTSSPAGSSATAPSASARAPRRASACPRPTSPRRATTSSLNRYKEVVHEEVEHRAAAGDPRRPRQAGGGDSAGDEGAGGDAEMSDWRSRTRRSCDVLAMATSIRRCPSQMETSDDPVAHAAGLTTSMSDVRATDSVMTSTTLKRMQRQSCCRRRCSCSTARRPPGRERVDMPEHRRALRRLSTISVLADPRRLDAGCDVLDFLLHYRQPTARRDRSSAGDGRDASSISSAIVAKLAIPLPALAGAAADCGGAGPGGGAAGQAPRRPRPTRHPHPSHLPRPVRRPRHESEGVADRQRAWWHDVDIERTSYKPAIDYGDASPTLADVHLARRCQTRD